MRNFYKNERARKYTVTEVQSTIIEFLKVKGVEVNLSDISDQVFKKHGIRFGNMSDVMAKLHKADKRIRRGTLRGFSKYVEYNEGGSK